MIDVMTVSLERCPSGDACPDFRFAIPSRETLASGFPAIDRRPVCLPTYPSAFGDAERPVERGTAMRNMAHLQEPGRRRRIMHPGDDPLFPTPCMPTIEATVSPGWPDAKLRQAGSLPKSLGPESITML